MNKDFNEFDKKIKEISNKEKETIPASLREKVNIIYDNLEPKKDKKAYKKYIKAAIISLVIITSTNFIFPTFAESIPVIGPIFTKINEEFGLSDVYSEYAVEVNKQLKIDDVTLTIESVAYDGLEIVMFYKVEGEEKLDRNIAYLMTSSIDGLEIKDKLRGSIEGGASGIGYYEDDYTFYGITKLNAEFSFFGFEIFNNPDKLNLEFIIYGCGEKLIDRKNALKFNVKLDSRDIPTKEVKIDKKINTEYGEIKMDKAVLTPLNLDIYYSLQSENNSMTTEFLINAIGLGPIESSSGSLSSSMINRSEGYARYSIYSMDEFNKISEITIIPKVASRFEIEENKESNKNKYEEIIINNNDVTKIDLKEKGTLELSNIKFLEDKTLIDVKATGNMIYEYVGLYSEEEYIYQNMVLDRSFENDEYKYTVVLDKMDKNKEYKYRYYPDYNNGDILEEESITIKFK